MQLRQAGFGVSRGGSITGQIKDLRDLEWAGTICDQFETFYRPERIALGGTAHSLEYRKRRTQGAIGLFAIGAFGLVVDLGRRIEGACAVCA